MRSGAAFFVKVKVKAQNSLHSWFAKLGMIFALVSRRHCAQIVIMGATESSYRKLGATLAKLQCVPRKRIEVDDTDGRVSI